MRENCWKQFFVFTLALVLLIPLSTIPAALARAGSGPPPVRRAVLIGINQYKTDDFMDLRGAVNDVDTMREILLTRFGFLPENIVVLVDENATRAAILDALALLVEQTQPEDFVYFHYSGHGSQVEDLNGDEKDDNRDETILPHDARTGEITDITDDELGAVLSQLRAKKALIVLDSCHSGTATRGLLATRSVPPDTRIELYRAQQSKVMTRAIVQLDTPERYVLFTGAASHQSALDGPLEGTYHGFFTYALAKGLGEARSDVSPEELHAGIEQIYARVSEDFGGLALPEPQFEGASGVLQQSIFPSERGEDGAKSSTASRPYLEVASESPGTVRLLRGVTLNASAGSLWAIYPPGETKFSQGQGLAVATVILNDASDAIAEVDPANTDLPAGCRAIELAPAPPQARVTVRWGAGEPMQCARLEKQITMRMPEVAFVSENDFARFVLEVASKTVRVFDAAGMAIVNEFPLRSDEEVAERLAGIFSRSLKASSLLSITNPASSLRIDARVAGIDSREKMRVRESGDDRSNRNSLMLELTANRDCYITIVDVDPEGSVNLLFPNSYTAAGFLPQGSIQADETIRIPDSIEKGNRAGFHWDCQPPVGVDTIQIFASTDLETAEAIRDLIRKMPGVTTRGASTQSVQERLQNLRATLTRQVATRGFKVVADESNAGEGSQAAPQPTSLGNDWNSISLRVEISE